MRLLNTESLRLELFLGSSVPKYAILSHMWGEEEVLFDDIHDPNQPHPVGKAGFAKIEGSCKQAREDGFKYIWIDTCCIDKSSSAELSEAINSMFDWYHQSERCYAYLADVEVSNCEGEEDEEDEEDGEDGVYSEENGNGEGGVDEEKWSGVMVKGEGREDEGKGNGDDNNETCGESRSNGEATSDGRSDDGEDEQLGTVGFEDSRWFSRGWTLQELIAPADVRFYDRNWSFLGVRQLDSSRNNRVGYRDLGPQITRRTRIPPQLLRWPTLGPERRSFWTIDFNPRAKLESVLDSFSVAQKMSWAASRMTTRPEDEAYSLMGLFGVNMPMLYGEGRRAFARLQQAILAVSDDQSILAFCHNRLPGASFPSGMSDQPLDLEEASSPLLATSPQCFWNSPIVNPGSNPPVWTGPGQPRRTAELSPLLKSLEVDLYLCPLRRGHLGARYLRILNCAFADDFTSHPAIHLHPLDDTLRTFVRIWGSQLETIRPGHLLTSYQAGDRRDAERT